MYALMELMQETFKILYPGIEQVLAVTKWSEFKLKSNSCGCPFQNALTHSLPMHPFSTP